MKSVRRMNTTEILSFVVKGSTFVESYKMCMIFTT